MRWLQTHLPKIVVAPSFAASLFFVYGFIAWTVYISFTTSGMLPRYELAGLIQYEKLFDMPRWDVAVNNLFVFGGLFILVSLIIGVVLAILLDQRIRAEGAIRTIYLYPMAVSFIVTGTAWKWILNPGLGLETVVQRLGWESFAFDWLIDPDMAIYTLVIAGVWQSSGFVMALFLAGLRAFDQEVVKAATIDGASMPRIYVSIILPSLRAVFLSAAYYLLPLYVMLSTSVKSLEEIRTGSLMALPTALTFEPWVKAWGSACVGVQCEGLQPYFLNSLLIVVPAVAISTLLGALNGYALTKWRFRGANVIFSLMLFGCFIPFQVILLPMARVLGLMGLAGSIEGLILVHVVYGLCFTTLFFRNFYVAVPDELVRAATIDGAGFWRIFWSILLPLSPPVIVVTVIWQFTQIYNDFLFGVSFTVSDGAPVTVALNNLVASSTGVKEYNVDMAAAILTALPTLLVYVVAGKYFIRGLSAGAVKG
jgi:glucose/mannose transport system permease protein